MMLYNFENLSLKLSVLGYPKTERRVFRVIKKADDYWDYHGHEFSDLTISKNS